MKARSNSGLVTLLALAALLWPGPRSADAKLDKATRSRLMRASVFILAANLENEKLVPVASGSGTIVSSDGLVLTNNHVVVSPTKPFDVVAIGLLKTFDQEPELKCLALPKNGVLDKALDLAVIRCEFDLQGRPYEPSNWPTVELGSSKQLIPGDDVWVVGYPGVGGTTINFTGGTISGFQGEQGGAGHAWIKTDAEISHGNSGGTAVDDTGMLIGVPSAIRLDVEKGGQTTGKVGLIRPIELARDLIIKAQNKPREDNSTEAAGVQGGPCYGNNTCNEGLTCTEGRCVNPAATGQAGGPCYGNNTCDEGLVCNSGTCAAPAVPNKGQADKAPAPSPGVTVMGKVVSADNGKPIQDAVVIVLKPGTTVASVTRDNLADSVFTKAITNARGEFIMEDPVSRDARYSVVVVAEGYAPLAADDILAPKKDTPDRWEPWVDLRLKHE